MVKKLLGCLVVVLVISPSAGVAARDRSSECEARRWRATGQYLACRMRAAARSIESGEILDTSKCDRHYAWRWQRIERLAGGDCPGVVSRSLATSLAAQCSAQLSVAMNGVPNGVCGNGVLEADEECDFNELAGATCESRGFDVGELACGSGCRYDTSACSYYTPTPAPTATPTPRPPKRVFVTSTAHFGDLGGLSGADDECNARAAAAGLGGTWVAWLSTPAVSAPDRLNDGRFVRLDGAPVARDIADLTDGTIDNPISIDELGFERSTYVWTGTADDGRYVAHGDDDCGDWTNGTRSGYGVTGHSQATDATWTQKAGARCNLCCPGPSIYCFEL